MLIIIAIAGTIYFKSPCLDDVWHTYDIDKESLERITRSETFTPENAKERLLKEDNVIHETFAVNDDKYTKNIKGTPESTDIQIIIKKCVSTDEAREVFYNRKYEYNDYGILAEGTSEKGEYFTTYMIQWRVDPEGWRMLTERYTKEINIRNGNLIISIQEDSYKGITEINDWLRILSEV